jgi:hypothetical protein
MGKIIEYCQVSADSIVLDDPFPFRNYDDDAYRGAQQASPNLRPRSMYTFEFPGPSRLSRVPWRTKWPRTDEFQPPCRLHT